MIITKSFKYDTERHLEIHEKINSLTKIGRGGEFSDYVRELIEKDCRKESTQLSQLAPVENSFPDRAELEKELERLRGDMQFLISLVKQLKVSGVAQADGESGDGDLTDQGLIEIVGAFEEAAANPEVKEITREEIKSKLKSRFKLE
jgi:hypothetical protein